MKEGTSTPYQPASAATNPIGCVSAWVGNLFRARMPAYVVPDAKESPLVARVRGVVLSRDPAFATTDGSDGPPGPIVGLTLVVDDDETAAAVLEALHAGAPVNVLSVARCRH